MNKKKKILLLSDDLRMHSGVAVMSHEIVKNTLHHYDWVQIGGAIDQAYTLRVYGNLRTNGIDELSDERWKKDVVKIEDALQKVLAMKGVYYNWRTEDFPENKFSDKLQVGFIAQELEKILPEVVSTDSKGYKSVMYGHVVALLV